MFGDIPRRRLYCLLTLPYLVQLAASTQPTLYFDEAALLAQMVLVAELLRWPASLTETDGGAGDYPVRVVSWLLVVVSVAVLGFSIKPLGAISLMLVLLVSAAAGIGYSLRRRMSLSRGIRPAIAVCTIAGIVLAGILVRNAILTGWLFFPLPAGNIHAEWSMPELARDGSYGGMQSVDGLYGIIKAWARLPGPEHVLALSGGFPVWFPKWRERVWQGVEPWLFYAGIALVAAHLIRSLLSRARREDILRDMLLAGLAASNLCFWFLTAPDMRFGRGFFWIWMGLGGCMVLSRVSFRPSAAYAVACLPLACLITPILAEAAPRHRPALWHIGTATARPTREIVLDNGQTPPLVLLVPKEGDQCGDAAIPCTPYPRDTLQMRKPGCLQAGFKIVPKE